MEGDNALFSFLESNASYLCAFLCLLYRKWGILVISNLTVSFCNVSWCHNIRFNLLPPKLSNYKKSLLWIIPSNVLPVKLLSMNTFSEKVLISTRTCEKTLGRVHLKQPLKAISLFQIVIKSNRTALFCFLKSNMLHLSAFLCLREPRRGMLVITNLII